ncbi:MAG TPA: Stp1/IreP family PP2C-type Ser/Thr phosphatase [Thermoanaerobaculia bacterium]|nr:Stp1/IreP family PP2C-type Ser/Thr phosphatase [Thermoanaerobaculia bacterium]
MTRAHNEDCFEIDTGRQLFVVADGMGGHSHGEIASRIAVETIRDFTKKALDLPGPWPYPYDSRLRHGSNILANAVRLAHRNVLKEIGKDAALQGMGTTVVGLLVDTEGASIAHVGDSRLYRWREGRLDLLTQDHTWVNEQVAAGFLSEEQARNHPLKNVVTRALGGEGEVQVDLQEVELRPKDRYLLCSDGLTTMLADGQIEAMFTEGATLEEICRRLVGEANRRGGIDNITVVVLEVEEDGR